MVEAYALRKVTCISSVTPLARATETYSVGGTDPGINQFHFSNDTAIDVEFLKSLLPSMSSISCGGSTTIPPLLMRLFTLYTFTLITTYLVIVNMSN